MKLHWEPITLDLKTTFRVAHGASDQRHNVLVYLEDGVGEAATVPYYGETRPGIFEYLQSVPDLGDDPFDLDYRPTDRLPCLECSCYRSDMNQRQAREGAGWTRCAGPPAGPRCPFYCVPQRRTYSPRGFRPLPCEELH